MYAAFSHSLKNKADFYLIGIVRQVLEEESTSHCQ